MIRAATTADLPAVAALEARGMQGGGWSEAQLAEELGRPDGHVLVARAARLLGHAIGRDLAGEGEVLAIVVAPEARRRGVGTALLVALLDRLEGPTFLEVRAGNAAARGLYAGHGFAEVGVRPRYYKGGEDAVLMRRP